MKSHMLALFIVVIVINGCKLIEFTCKDNSENTDCLCTGLGSTCVCSPSNPTRDGLPCSINSSGKDSVSLFFVIVNNQFLRRLMFFV